MTHCSSDQVRASHGSQNEDKTLLQRSQHCHKGEFWHVSINARQRSLQCGQNLRGPFLRATLPMTVGSFARLGSDGGQRGDKRDHNPATHTRWVSAPLLYVCVTSRQQSRGCSQYLCSSFLWAVRLFNFIRLDYITRHNFSPTRSVITQNNISSTRSVTLRGTIFPLPGV